MRARRQARILERVVAVESLEELLTAREAEWRAVCQVLAGVIRGRCARAVARAASLRGVSEEYVADRVAVLAASLGDIRRHDPYAVLGVSPAASAQGIQRRWREVVKTCHPDVVREPAAAETFRRLRLAYETLRDPERRARWDARQLEHGGLPAQRAAAVFVEALECDRVGWWDRAPVRRAARAAGGGAVRCGRLGATLSAAACRAAGRSVAAACRSLAAGLKAGCRGLGAACRRLMAGLAAGCRGLAVACRSLVAGLAVACRSLAAGCRSLVAGFATGCRRLTRIAPVLRSGAVTASRHGWRSARAAARIARASARRSRAAVGAGGALARSGAAGALSAARHAAARPAVTAARVGRDAAGRAAGAAARGGRAVAGLGAPLRRMAERPRVFGARLRRAGHAAGYGVVRVAIAAGRVPGCALHHVGADVRACVAWIAALTRGIAIGCRRAARHAAAIGTVAAAVTAVFALAGVSGDRQPGAWHGYDRLARTDDAGGLPAPAASPSLMLATARPMAAEQASVEPRASLKRPSEPSAALRDAPESRPRPTMARGARATGATRTGAARSVSRPRPGAVPSPAAPRVARSEAGSAPTVGTKGPEHPSSPAARVGRSEAAPPAAARIERSEAAALLSTFRRRYEQRDVGGLVGLFAEDGIEDRRAGRESIAAAYESALRPWQQITYRLGGLSYEDRPDAMRVTSPFVITYARRDGAQIVRGTAAWDLVRRDGGLRIARLSYRIER